MVSDTRPGPLQSERIVQPDGLDWEAPRTSASGTSRRLRRYIVPSGIGGSTDTARNWPQGEFVTRSRPSHSSHFSSMTTSSAPNGRSSSSQSASNSGTGRNEPHRHQRCATDGHLCQAGKAVDSASNQSPIVKALFNWAEPPTTPNRPGRKPVPQLRNRKARRAF